MSDNKDPSREHVSRHFSDELTDIVMGFEDPTQCTQCTYKSDKTKNVAIHIALVHSILDHFLSDQELIKTKREKYVQNLKKSISEILALFVMWSLPKDKIEIMFVGILWMSFGIW